jgi:DNA polymerase-3 subunit gamma/tau
MAVVAAATPSTPGAAPWDDEPPWVREEAEGAASPPLPDGPWAAEAAPQRTDVAADRRPMPSTSAARDTREPAAAIVLPDGAPPHPAAPRADAVVAQAPNPLQDRWGELLQQLLARSAVTGLVRELAWQAECTAIDAQAEPPVWRLCVERESLRQASHRERLQAALIELTGQALRLEVVAGEVVDSAARRDAAAKARAQQAAEDLIQGDPVVQQLLARYPGSRIVPGSIRPR